MKPPPWPGIGVLLCLWGLGCQPESVTDPVPHPKKSAPRKKPSPIQPSKAQSEQLAPAEETPETPDEASTVFRPDAEPRAIDKERAEQAGIRVLSGKALDLWTDSAAAEELELETLSEQLLGELEDYFGKLPPSRDRQPYRVVGFLMRDEDRFRQVRLLPGGPARAHEGWFHGQEFWLREQPSTYYNRHLSLHEVAHCFMYVMPHQPPPAWYMEGMAEMFATHQFPTGQSATYRYWPTSPQELVGWARISLIQEDVRAGKAVSLDEILAYTDDDFTRVQTYAWSWALCSWLDGHPRYQIPFRKLAKSVLDGGFRQRFKELFAEYLPQLRGEWALFSREIQYGHDIPRTAIQWLAGQPFKADQTAEFAIAADRGWQSSGIRCEAGKTYHLTTQGQFTLGQTPKPWVSEAQGISYRYFAGYPLGQLQGWIAPDDSSDQKVNVTIIPLGAETTFTTPLSGTLYLRLNEAGNSLADNTGSVTVTLSPPE